MKLFKILIISLLFFTSCNNDDGNATNQSNCDYQGFSYLDTSSNDQTILPESELNTQYFPNASNGPYGAPGIEIASFTSSPTLFFTTNVIDLNEIGTGLISIDGAELEAVTVTCQRAGTLVGDEVRLDVVYGSIEVEFCVIIDEVL
ncbi:hypothetical protein KO494_04365 [Lacinutrix sp. C3R15]|uniref:hypothetical protein n=1 Tax=Flavobacteriaceae TaxID=49546 RepID=UPI001C0A4B27|nr:MULTISPECIES: hypothetical protein [Flavobacteriaceae]MBU2938771.1 hypothetical protein [Lacinutrix sp. C3R15]MDO6622084.1 hypothetical protein [Oceanihabitans sp. 1_MG-2023]